MSRPTEIADALCMAAEHATWAMGAQSHLRGCRPDAGPLSACEPGCVVDELQRAVDAYLRLRSERPHGWRGYFSRKLADAIAAASRAVGQ